MTWICQLVGNRLQGFVSGTDAGWLYWRGLPDAIGSDSTTGATDEG